MSDLPTPTPYFFYGTLTHLPILSQVLSRPLYLPDPVLHPATPTGYTLRLWGPYPCLVPSPSKPPSFALDSSTQPVVEGMLCDIYLEEESKLQWYETTNYRPMDVRVWVEQKVVGKGKGVKKTRWDEEEVVGEVGAKTFVFCGDEREVSGGKWTLEGWLEERDRERGREEAELERLERLVGEESHDRDEEGE